MRCWSKHCYVCGEDNEYGLRLKFCFNSGVAFTHGKFRKEWEGFPGVVHGGVVAAVLDEVMWYAALSNFKEYNFFTYELNVMYKRSSAAGSFEAFAKVIEASKRKCVVEAKLYQNGQLKAQGRGVYLKTLRKVNLDREMKCIESEEG